MNLPRLALSATSGLVAAVVAVGVVSADKPPPPPKPPVVAPPALPARRAAPLALSAAVRAARVKAALTSAGFASLAAAVSAFKAIVRLTPIAPAHASGAAITYLGPGVLLGADADEPHGSFLLQHSSVQMRFPTTAQKVYLLSCRFELFNQHPVTIKRAGATPVSMPVDAGHILHAFQATGPSTNLIVEVLPPGNFPVTGYFYGCDLEAN